jgi:ketosteroid isomerase-like protein
MSQENVEVLRGVRITLPPLSERAAQRRTLDERLYVRFPTLLPRLVSAVLRLRTRSRLRRVLLSRLIRRGWAASDRGDLGLCLCGYDPDVEISWPETGSMAIPDLRGTYRGHEGFRRVWRGMHAPWKLEVRPQEVIDVGDRLLFIADLSARGKGSGVPIGGSLICLFTYRAGRIVREQYFNTREEALEAAGLRE